MFLLHGPSTVKTKNHSLRETLINYLSGRIAKLQCRAVRYYQQVQLVPVGSIYRNLNIFLYMSRFLRSVRLALHPAQTINQCFLRGYCKKPTFPREGNLCNCLVIQQIISRTPYLFITPVYSVRANEQFCINRGALASFF